MTKPSMKPRTMEREVRGIGWRGEGLDVLAGGGGGLDVAGGGGEGLEGRC